MQPKRILVSGAGGFLGCRLVERCLLSEKVPVRAMAHRPSGAVRLARLPVEVAWCDITQPSEVRKALEGCDVVVHCAYGATGIPSANRKATVSGSAVLAREAVAAGVRRFVHISSMAVHSYAPAPGTSEASPFARNGDFYCRDKVRAEEKLWKLHASRGLPLVVLRMGNIYGPFSGPWTVRPLAHIRSRMVSLVDGGQHASNMAFVDNAVEAIFASIREDAALGEAFFITDAPMTWAELYGKYGAWLGANPISADLATIRTLIEPRIRDRGRRVVADVWGNVLLPSLRFSAFRMAESKTVGPLASAVWKLFPEAFKERFLGCQADGSPLIHPGAGTSADDTPCYPPPGLLQVYAGKTGLSSEKAKRLLGYLGRVGFEEATAITEAWAKWARLV